MDNRKKLSDNLNSREQEALIIKPFAKHGLAELTKGVSSLQCLPSVIKRVQGAQKKFLREACCPYRTEESTSYY